MKSDLQKITLSAVSADGLYFSTDVPVITIRKSDKRPLCLGEFERHFGSIPHQLNNNNPAILDYMCTTLKSQSPNPTQWEAMFLDLYFGTLKAFAKGDDESPSTETNAAALEQSGEIVL